LAALPWQRCINLIHKVHIPLKANYHQPTKPNQIKPNQTKPNQTKPNQTKPNKTKPNKYQTKPNAPYVLGYCITFYFLFLGTKFSPALFVFYNFNQFCVFQVGSS
jgi:hypothetical protein